MFVTKHSRTNSMRSGSLAHRLCAATKFPAGHLGKVNFATLVVMTHLLE